MKNDEAIQKAVAFASKKKTGRQSDIARLTGLSTGTISRIATGIFMKIDDDTYPKLYPVIAPYLPKAFDGLPLHRYRPPEVLDLLDIPHSPSMAIGEESEPYGDPCPRCGSVTDTALDVARKWQRASEDCQRTVLYGLEGHLNHQAEKKESPSSLGRAC